MRAILTYHSIDPSGSPISVSPETFDRHVAWLASGRVRVVSLAEIAAPAHRTPDDLVALTFDDAFDNFGTVAWPRLRAHALPATVYVVTRHVGGTNAWGGRAEPGIPHLPLMTWEALGRCRDEGLDVAAHTRTHPRLHSLSDAQVDEELIGSRDDLRTALDVTAASFAYPYGVWSAASATRAREVFGLACTDQYRTLGDADDAALLPRLDAFYFQAPGAFDDWGTPTFRARVALRHGLRRARRLARRVMGTS